MHSSVKKHSNCMRPKKKSFTCLETAITLLYTESNK